jgi:hypothetical protein
MLRSVPLYNETLCGENRSIAFSCKIQSTNMKFFLSLIKRCRVKTYGRVEASLHIVRILTLDVGECSAPRLSRFNSG